MTLSTICKTREVRTRKCVHLLQFARQRNKDYIISTLCKSPPISTEWPMTSTSPPSPVRASLCWLWWVIMLQFGCSSTVGHNNSVKAHVTRWRSKRRRWGISGLRDWWPVYCCSVFHCLSWNKHHNNAVMSGALRLLHPPAPWKDVFHTISHKKKNVISSDLLFLSYLHECSSLLFLFWHSLSLLAPIAELYCVDHL